MSALPAARLHRPVPAPGPAPGLAPGLAPDPSPPRPGRTRSDERAYVTAETAVLLPFLVVVLALLVWIVSLGITQVRLVDAAREGARAVARGDDADLVRASVAREAPDGSTVDVTSADGATTVVVRVRSAPSLPVLDRLPGAPLTASATTPDEAGAPVVTIPGSTRPGTSADDRGSATVLVLAACLVLAVGSAIGVQVAGLVAVKHRAAAAADLAALAGADVATAGGDPCPAAGRAARLNRARLERCRQDGAVVTVSVSSGSPRLWGRRWRVERTARAAPSDWTLPASRAGPGG